MAKILLAIAEGDALETVRHALSTANHTVEAVHSGRDAVAALACNDDLEIVVADVGLADLSGVALCRAVVEEHRDLPVVLLADDAALATGIAAIRAGAFDYLARPLDPHVFLVSVERALQHHALRREITALQVDDRELLRSLPTLQQIERRYIARVLGLAANNKTTASRVLGIDRKTLYRKLETDAEAEQPPAKKTASAQD